MAVISAPSNSVSGDTILFEDKWTHEVVMRFRDRHQDPSSTDIEYCAKINGYDSTQDLINAITSAPYLVTFMCFMPGLANCFQMVSQDKQLETPKYIRPRTFTPQRALGLGGAFASLYPVDGAGGYQLVGISAAPTFDREQKLPDFKNSMVFPRQGDILQFRSITSSEYDDIRDQVESGTFKFRTKELEFSPKEVLSDPEEFAQKSLRRFNDYD